MIEAVIEWGSSIIDELAALIFILGYFGIFLLMMLESSFIPFPSEVILIPAGVLVAKGEMNFILALIAGTGGSLAGAYVNYFLAKRLGRPTINHLLDRYGKLFFIKHKDIERSEAFFHKHGNMATFTGRLIPMIRQLVSLPAGFYHMRLLPFTTLTALGAGIWTAILLAAGYLFESNRTLIEGYLYQFKLLLVLAVLLGIAAYFLWQYRYKLLKKKKNH